MPLKFVVTKDPRGKFSFSVMSRNGQVIARSDAYSSRAAALGGIGSVRAQAGAAEVEDQSTKAWADAELARQSAASASQGTAKKATAAGKSAPPGRSAARSSRPENKKAADARLAGAKPARGSLSKGVAAEPAGVDAGEPVAATEIPLPPVELPAPAAKVTAVEVDEHPPAPAEDVPAAQHTDRKARINQILGKARSAQRARAAQTPVS